MNSGAMVMGLMAWACLVAFALAALFSGVEGWPQRLPSTENTRLELANRLTPRMRRLTRTLGWMTVGLIGVLTPAPFVLRTPLFVALVLLGWLMVDAPRVSSGADVGWLRRVKFVARLACFMTIIASGASLMVGLHYGGHSWLIAAGALLLAGAQAHSVVAEAAEDVLELAL